MKEKVRGEKIRTPAWAPMQLIGTVTVLSELPFFQLCNWEEDAFLPGLLGALYELLYIRQLVGAQHC